MSQYIKQGNIFGRIGSGIGQGLAEQLPKEIERGRLASGLQQLNQQKNLSPQEYFTQALSVPGLIDRPQVIQSLENLARQRSVIDSAKQQRNQLNEQLRNPKGFQETPQQGSNQYRSATTKEGVEATLNPKIPRSGEEREILARQLLANEPYIYPNIEAARAAVNNMESADVEQSNAKIAKRKLEQDVQKETENELKKEIGIQGANIPGRMQSRLGKKAIEDVRSGKLTENEAAEKYGKEANQISRDFSKIKGWGGLDLLTNKAKDLFGAIRSLREKYPDREDRRDIADSMISENDMPPDLAYAQVIPVSEIPSLNKELKDLPDIKPKFEKVAGLPGLAGVGIGRPKNVDPVEKTREIAPKLLKAMGTQGSPLSIGYELRKKGYDPLEWKEYLLDHKDELTGHQYEELGLTQKGLFGLLNDWWFRSFTGIK